MEVEERKNHEGPKFSDWELGKGRNTLSTLLKKCGAINRPKTGPFSSGRLMCRWDVGGTPPNTQKKRGRVFVLYLLIIDS